MLLLYAAKNCKHRDVTVVHVHRVHSSKMNARWGARNGHHTPPMLATQQ